MGSDPEIVGRYVLHGEIASGGMARVYFASLRGATGFSRLVAVKRLHPHIAHEHHMRAMFIDEACLSSRIHHPNVVSTLDIVHHGDDLLLVMEYVHGESLRALVRAMRSQRASIPFPIVLGVMANVLHGLHAVHEALAEDGTPLAIVHRDISPSNIMVGVDGAARILDFGIAHAARRLEMTRVGTLKGKLAYMAPEQFGGRGVTRHADIFSAGVVLWELLVGRRLFARGDDGDAVLMEKIVRGAEEKPSDVRPGVPSSLDAIAMMALARDPHARFTTARVMALALEGAGDLATMSEVADWVRDAAADTLARHAAVVRRIERDSVTMRAAVGDAILEATNLERAPTSTIPVAHNVYDRNTDGRGLAPAPESLSSSDLIDEKGARRISLRNLGLAMALAIVVFGITAFATRYRSIAVSSPSLPRDVPRSIAAPPPPSPPPPPCEASMVTIPGGKFFMGSDDDLPIERPSHAVTLAPYCIDTFEVTTADYKSCSDHGDCKRAGMINKWPRITDDEHTTFDPLCNARDPSLRAQQPINCVTFDMAEIYCRARGKRLPTEAEWELAARGSDGRMYPWGDEAPSASLLNACGAECVKWGLRNRAFDLKAMFPGDDGWAATSPVGTFPKGASPFGAQDMAGNVWEWVGDWYADYPAGEQFDPHGPHAGTERVVRGGAWNGAYTASVRGTFRYKEFPDKRSHGIGFRCAKPQSQSR